MGMDCYIWSSKNHEVFKHGHWWDSEQVTEEWYSRKPWDLVQNCSFIPKNYESGDFIELTKENIEEMISVACHYKSYWGNYDYVAELCELRDKFDEGRKNGKIYFLEYDW